MIAEAALQEDVDAIGLSILSGAHITLFPAVIDAHQGAQGADDVVVFGGGIIPDEDIRELRGSACARSFARRDHRGHRRVGARERPAARGLRRVRLAARRDGAFAVLDSPDVLIVRVGAGPAGSALALHLAALAPDVARRTLVVEKHRHPRHKVCAGGLIPHTLACLRELDVPLAVPHAMIQRATARTPRGDVQYGERDLCAVVRRSEFDALLAACVRERGVALAEDERVVDIRREGGTLRASSRRGARSARGSSSVPMGRAASFTEESSGPSGKRSAARCAIFAPATSAASTPSATSSTSAPCRTA